MGAKDQNNNLGDLLKKVSRRNWIIIGVIALVIIGSISVFSHRKINVLRDAKVTFSGYEGSGNVDYNQDDLETKEVKAFVECSGLSDELSEQVEKGLEDHDNIADLYYSADSSDRQKMRKIADWSEELKTTVTGDHNLRNGQKIKLTISNGGDDTNPIKATSKDVKAHGLKAVKKSSASEITDKFKVSFYGLNKRGFVRISSKHFDSSSTTFNVKNNGKLQNGDEIKIAVPSEMFNKEGIDYTGTHSISATVSGLVNSTSIKNVDKINDLTDSIINDHFQSNDYLKYSNRLVNIFLTTPEDSGKSNGYGSWGSSTSDQDDSEVTLNAKSSSDNDGYKVIALYRVTKSYDNDSDGDDSELDEVVLSDLKLSDSKLNIDDISTKDDSNVNDVSDSQSIELHNLNAAGIQIK
ncbi:hypothetical protein ACRYI5_10915 [Furfurilactobacillus sp. WILCCON 0119]